MYSAVYACKRLQRVAAVNEGRAAVKKPVADQCPVKFDSINTATGVRVPGVFHEQQS